MGCSTREEVTEAHAAHHAAVSRLLDLNTEALTPPELLRCLQNREIQRRRQCAAEHALINQLRAQATEKELGGRLHTVLADLLHITPAEARRRIADAEALGPRHTLTGQPLPPKMPATAAAQRDGSLGDGHVLVIRKFLDALPSAVDAGTRAAAEEQLAALATERRPDALHGLAQQLTDWLNPDGTYTDDDRARKRGLTLGKQEPDGMSRLHGYVDPELRATLEAIDAKLGTPGKCNRDDHTPVIDHEPSPDAARHDMRSKAQRFHDGLLTGLRALLMSGKLGQHNGLPTSIIITTTLNELEAAAGRGLTGGGTILPMSDVIRQARHARHYLAIFDNNGKALALYHTNRLANPAQRLVLYAKHRGCTFPGCPVRGYYCEVHHAIPYATSGVTDVNGLGFGCGEHHPLAEEGWTTRTNAKGDTEWIPPGHLDSGIFRGRPRTNRYHHPEKLLYEHDRDDDKDEPD